MMLKQDCSVLSGFFAHGSTRNNRCTVRVVSGGLRCIESGVNKAAELESKVTNDDVGHRRTRFHDDLD